MPGSQLECIFIFIIYAAIVHAKDALTIIFVYRNFSSEPPKRLTVGQFREFESRRVNTHIKSLGLFLVHELTFGKGESVS